MSRLYLGKGCLLDDKLKQKITTLKTKILKYITICLLLFEDKQFFTHSSLLNICVKYPSLAVRMVGLKFCSFDARTF